MENLEEARRRDTRAAEAWIGHPYVDVIDNSRLDCGGASSSLVTLLTLVIIAVTLRPRSTDSSAAWHRRSEWTLATGSR